jgi:hypothetical protein
MNIQDTDVQELLKEIVSINNNDRIISINETNAKRLLQRHTEHGYIIISACRGKEYFDLDLTQPKNVNKINQINNKRTQELLNDIKAMGFSYTPCFGGFIENLDSDDEEQVYEKSFIVYPYKKDKTYNFAELKKFAIEMCNKYDQNSVLIKAPTENPKYYLKSGVVDMEFNGDAKFNDITQEYFTDLHKNTSNKIKNDSKPTRFTFTESYIPRAPITYSERHTRFLKGEIFIGR